MPTDTNPTPSTAMSTMNPDPNLVHITHDLLVQLDACREHRDIFDTTFPDGVTLTTEPDVDTVTHIVASGLDVGWLCQRVLSSSAEAEYLRAIAPAWAEYQRAIAPAYAECLRAIAPAWAEYLRAIAPAWAEYQRAIAPARAEHQRVRDAAWVEYQRAIAPAWAEYQRAIARAAWCALSDRGNWS